GLWFPVDISTASRATIGGMVGNNSCGARSLRYGNTRENVVSIDAVLAEGTRAHFGRIGDSGVNVPPALVRDLVAIASREAAEIERRFPKVQRRVGGYNLDAIVPGRNDINLAHLLVGSEGTLAFSTGVELKLSPLLGRRDLGLAWDKTGAKWGGVVDVLDPKLQAAIGEVRTAGLNIMMSMKEEGKPISFVEDCAVPLDHLADYTARLTEIFERNGTRGTWYAHAAVGCLHVRPVL